MLIKFFPRSVGAGSGPTNYVTRAEGREEAEPEVLRGAPDMTRDLIDSIDRKHRYTSGVISFAREDAPSLEQQERVMDAFERTAFAGLEANQYDILWVRHSHTEGGRVELHFVTPRTELTTGKAFNIAPPGWQKTFDPLRDVLNYENGWARPDDPERQRVTQRVNEKPERLESREAINAYLEEKIAEGAVSDRASLLQALKEAGFEINRQGKDYVSVKDPQSSEKFRLKGAIYGAEWKREQLERAPSGKSREGSERSRNLDAERAREARERLERRIEQRAQFNRAQFCGDLREFPEKNRSTELKSEADRAKTEALAAPKRERDRGVDRFDLSWALDSQRVDSERHSGPSERIGSFATTDRHSERNVGSSRAEDGRGEIVSGQQRRMASDYADAPKGHDVDSSLFVSAQQNALYKDEKVRDDGAVDAARARAFESFWGHREPNPRLGRAIEDARSRFNADWERSRAAERESEQKRQRELEGQLERLREPNEGYRERFSAFAERVRDAARQIESLRTIRERTTQLLERGAERVRQAAERFGIFTERIDQRLETVREQERLAKQEHERNSYGHGMGR